MADFQFLDLNLAERILTITINRPDSLNALNNQTMDEIQIAFQHAYDEDDVKGVIVTGAGEKAFVAGADISEISELNEVNSRKFSENGQEVFSNIEGFEKPVIAAVNGFALGGGCELAMACHLRIASENARFGLPEVKLGLIPGYGGTQRLTHLIGRGKAVEMMMTGEMITAQEALHLGLVNHLVTSGELMDKCKSVMKQIIDQAPMAIANIIRSVNAAFDPEENGYQTEANSFSNCVRTEDFKEGTSAFLEKRTPSFKGE